MPDVNGHQFLEAYAWKDEAAPVIVLSADKQESSYDMSIELGAKAMINKPAKLDKIEMALSKVLN